MKKNLLKLNLKQNNQSKKRKNYQEKSIAIRRKFQKQQQEPKELKKEQLPSKPSMKNTQKNL